MRWLACQAIRVIRTFFSGPKLFMDCSTTTDLESSFTTAPLLFAKFLKSTKERGPPKPELDPLPGYLPAVYRL